MRRLRRLSFLLFGLSVFFTLAALTGLQATGPTAGPRLLGRLAAAMFELNRWTPAHVEDVQAGAKDRIRGAVEVPGLPLQVSVPVDVAGSADEGELQAAITERAGLQLYERGRAAFADDSGQGGDISLTQPARWVIGLLEKEDHAAWKVAMAAGLLGAIVTGMPVLLASNGVRALAAGTLAGAVAFAGVSGSAFVFARLIEDAAGSVLDRELFRIAADCAWMGLRAGGVVALGATGILLLTRLTGRSGSRHNAWLALDEAA